MDFRGFAATQVVGFLAHGNEIMGSETKFSVRGYTPTASGIVLVYEVEPGPFRRRLGNSEWDVPDRAILMELLARTYRVRSRRVDRTTWEIPALPDTWSDTLSTHFPIFRGSEMAFDSGWFDLCAAMGDWLQAVAPDIKPFSQTKEKFGELRLYYGPREGLAASIVESASFLSEYICEVCGARGHNKTVRGWARTLCDRHRDV